LAKFCFIGKLGCVTAQSQSLHRFSNSTILYPVGSKSGHNTWPAQPTLKPLCSLAVQAAKNNLKRWLLIGYGQLRTLAQNLS